MENTNDRYLIPFGLGSELDAASFQLTQNDNTYLLAGPRYKQFYSSYIRPRTAMFRGWIEGFHNTEHGVIPSLFLQKIATGITSTIFGKPLILNSEDAQTNQVTQNQYKKSNFGFAAKEALYKAVSALLPERFGISWSNAQIINDKNGNPKIEFLNIEFKQIKSMDISISHCREYAVATVIIMVDE